MLLENEAFLTELTNLFNANRTKGGSLYITMKRYDGRTKPKPRSTSNANTNSNQSQSQQSSNTESKCLIRAHIGKKKIATVIGSKDINKFQLAYSNLMKGNLYGLKKKVKKKVGIDK